MCCVGRTNVPSSTDADGVVSSDLMTTSATTVGGPVKIGNPNNPKATAAAAAAAAATTTATTTTVAVKTGTTDSVNTDVETATSSPGIPAVAPTNPLPAGIDLTGPVSEVLLTGPVNSVPGPANDVSVPNGGDIPSPVNGFSGPISGDLMGPVSEILLTGPAGGDLSGPSSKLADVFIEPSEAITSGSSLSTTRNQQPILGTEVEEGILDSNAAAEAAASAKTNKNHTIFSELDANGLVSLALISLACVSLLSVVWCTLRTVTQLRSNARSKSMPGYGESEHQHHSEYLVYNKNKNNNSNNTSQLMNQSSTSHSFRERSEESDLTQSPYGACERDALLWQDSNI